MDTKPGDGKSSPFGNGQGGSSMAGGGGNNFLTNPGGGGAAGKGPGGNDGGGTLGERAASRKQKSGPDPDISTDEIPEGGLMPFGKSTDSADDAGNPVGGVVDRPARMPFKLDGGG